MALEIALHTVLKPGAEAAYDQIHAVIPEELDRALRAAGVLNWRIWRDGRHLFHLVRVQDPARMRQSLRADPANHAWQRRMAELLEVADDYDDDGQGLPMVWELP